MVFPDDISEKVLFTKRAAKDLADLLKKDRGNFDRVWNDLKRLASGTLPQRPKKLKGFLPPLWQIDSGDFRIFVTLGEEQYVLRGVLAKPDQKKRFRGMR